MDCMTSNPPPPPPQGDTIIVLPIMDYAGRLGTVGGGGGKQQGVRHSLLWELSEVGSTALLVNLFSPKKDNKMLLGS